MRHHGIVISDNDFSLADIVYKVDCFEGKSCAADGIHEGFVFGDFGAGDWDRGVVFDVSVSILVPRPGY